MLKWCEDIMSGFRSKSRELLALPDVVHPDGQESGKCKGISVYTIGSVACYVMFLGFQIPGIWCRSSIYC